ncbi:MAG TPA: hypothetical protein VLB81_07020 [Gaiellales bacterium]|nr:hypothetical protein [Gaiellales bacterium]
MRRVLLAALVASLAAPGAAQAHRVRLAAPAQFDVAVAQVRYAVPHGPRPALRLALAGPTGLDYVAVALPRRQPRHAAVALVAVVNRRPRGSQAPDLAQVLLSTRPTRAMRAPTVSQATNVLAAAPAHRPAACGLGSLEAGDLRFAVRAGTPPPGFGARATIVQALNAACGRPVAASFLAAVAPPAVPSPSPPPPSPCPPCPPFPPGKPTIICPTPAPAACPEPA